MQIQYFDKSDNVYMNLQVPDGLGVRIPGFHPGGPGSIPGLGASFFSLNDLVSKAVSRKIRIRKIRIRKI